MEIKKDIIWRVAVVYIVMLLFAVGIIARIFYLQFFEHEKWMTKSDSLVLKEMVIQPNRGDIFAVDGRVLATSLPYYEIRMDVNSSALTDEIFYQKIDSLASCLSTLFNDEPASEYKHDLIKERRKGNHYYLVKRRVDYYQLIKLQGFPIFRLGRYKGGLIIEQENTRILPHGNLAARTIGYLSDGGSVGIEGSFDKELKGVTGVRTMQKIAGNIWMPVEDRNTIEPKDGKDIISTIDINIQDVAENALLKQLVKANAQHGSAILMEVKTGEIKAIVNLQRNPDDSYSENYNFAIGESTEPGSTFKLASLLAAFEDGYITLNDSVNTGDGKIQFYDVVLTDTKKGGYGKISVKQAFALSSNVGVSKIITRLYKGKEKQFVDHLINMELNRVLGIDIKGEGKPLIKYPSDPTWSGLTLPWMSIGYEVRLTPLQILTFYNAIANDGVMVKPHFVKAITDHGQIIKEYDPEVINPSICSKKSIKAVHEMLEAVVESGTATNLKNETYKIAGKTGTAQIANKKYGYYHNNGVSYQASFVGYFPADEPKYSIIVVVNSPSKDVYYGNLVAGPVFKEIADKVYATSFDLQPVLAKKIRKPTDIPYSKNSYREDFEYVTGELKIPVDDKKVTTDWISTLRKEDCIEMQNRTIVKNLVPNTMGMGAKDAVFLLENAGLHVELVGRGNVISQSIQPGEWAYKGESIVLELGG